MRLTPGRSKEGKQSSPEETTATKRDLSQGA